MNIPCKSLSLHQSHVEHTHTGTQVFGLTVRTLSVAIWPSPIRDAMTFYHCSTRQTFSKLVRINRHFIPESWMSVIPPLFSVCTTQRIAFNVAFGSSHKRLITMVISVCQQLCKRITHCVHTTHTLTLSCIAFRRARTQYDIAQLLLLLPRKLYVSLGKSAHASCLIARECCVMNNNNKIQLKQMKTKNEWGKWNEEKVRENSKKSPEKRNEQEREREREGHKMLANVFIVLSPVAQVRTDGMQ